MKTGGGLHPVRPDCWRPIKQLKRVTPGGCAPMLAHVPSFGWKPRGSSDFLAYAIPRLASGVVFVLGFQGALVLHTPPRVPKQPRP